MKAKAAKPGKASKPAAKRAKRPMGRPTLYTPKLWAELIDRLSSGETLQDICRDEHMPSAAVVYDWTDPTGESRPKGIPATLTTDFARARARGHDAIAAGTLRIADDGRNDWMERHGEDSPGWALNGEHVQRSKLRIWTRLQLLAKWDRRYGDKLELAGDVTVKKSAANMSDDELAAIIAASAAKKVSPNDTEAS